jgi:hypothetical protein
MSEPEVTSSTPVDTFPQGGSMAEILDTDPGDDNDDSVNDPDDLVKPSEDEAEDVEDHGDDDDEEA